MAKKLMRCSETGKLMRDSVSGKLMRSVPPEIEYGDGCELCEPALWAVEETPKYVKVIITGVIPDPENGFPAPPNDTPFYLKQKVGTPCRWELIREGDFGSIFEIDQYNGTLYSSLDVILYSTPPDGVAYFCSMPEGCQSSFVNEVNCSVTYFSEGTAEVTWGVGIGQAEYDAQF